MKLITFFVSRTRQIYAKTIVVSESAFKMKVMPAWTLFELLLASAVSFFARKRNCTISSKLHIPRYQSRPFQKATSFYKRQKNSYPKTTHVIFTCRSIFRYFLRLTCFNFRTALTKSVILYVLEIAL